MISPSINASPITGGQPAFIFDVEQSGRLHPEEHDSSFDQCRGARDFQDSSGIITGTFLVCNSSPHSTIRHAYCLCRLISRDRNGRRESNSRSKGIKLTRAQCMVLHQTHDFEIEVTVRPTMVSALVIRLRTGRYCFTAVFSTPFRFYADVVMPEELLSNGVFGSRGSQVCNYVLSTALDQRPTVQAAQFPNSPTFLCHMQS